MPVPFLRAALLAGLVLMSCVKALTTLEAPWRLFTSENWHTIATDPTLRRSITNSLLIAGAGGAATVLLVAVATMIAHRSDFPLRRFLGLSGLRRQPPAPTRRSRRPPRDL